MPLKTTQRRTKTKSISHSSNPSNQRTAQAKYTSVTEFKTGGAEGAIAGNKGCGGMTTAAVPDAGLTGRVPGKKKLGKLSYYRHPHRMATSAVGMIFKLFFVQLLHLWDKDNEMRLERCLQHLP